MALVTKQIGIAEFKVMQAVVSVASKMVGDSIAILGPDLGPSTVGFALQVAAAQIIAQSNARDVRTDYDAACAMAWDTALAELAKLVPEGGKQ